MKFEILYIALTFIAGTISLYCAAAIHGDCKKKHTDAVDDEFFMWSYTLGALLYYFGVDKIFSLIFK